MSWVYFLENKSETFEKLRHYKAKVEKQSGRFIKSLHSDRGGEFLSNEFKFFCEENGIHRELTTPYTPEQRCRREEESDRCGDDEKHVAHKRASESILGRGSSDIYLFTKHISNKSGHESSPI